MTELKPISEIEKKLYEVLGRILYYRCSECCETGTPLVHGGKKCAWCMKDALEPRYVEPTLNDVLLKLYEMSSKHIRYHVDCFGNLMKVNTEYCAGDDYICGLKLEESFDNWSEDTKRKLYALICTK